MSEWERRRCGDERGVGQVVAAIMHTRGGGARVVAEVGGAVPRVARLGVRCASSSSSRARAGGAPRARARPKFQLEDAKRGVPGRRVRVWARCARWKAPPLGAPWGGGNGSASFTLVEALSPRKTAGTLGPHFWVKPTSKFLPTGSQPAQHRIATHSLALLRVGFGS